MAKVRVIIVICLFLIVNSQILATFARMNQQEKDELYMRRCLQLASNGLQNARPNPMVGAVIVDENDHIIGEGYHQRCGSGHAEVNAFASVSAADGALLSKSTLYVSLEPCSHYGRTPPCADLIVKKGIRRCVVGCVDPFAKVKGRGIKKLLDAGISVTTGVLEEECLQLNRRFMTFHQLGRPYVILKWCQTANGFLDDNFRPAMFSSPFTQMLSHKLRAENDAILVGRTTNERDAPQLTVRHWSGRNPLRLVIDRCHPFTPEADFSSPIVPQVLGYLHQQGKQSLIVEGGATTLQSFITSGAWDELRIETAPTTVNGGTAAPTIPQTATLTTTAEYDHHLICTYLNKSSSTNLSSHVHTQ